MHLNAGDPASRDPKADGGWEGEFCLHEFPLKYPTPAHVVEPKDRGGRFFKGKGGDPLPTMIPFFKVLKVVLWGFLFFTKLCKNCAKIHLL